ncbi:hypothetical protein, partial [Shivajiella indica]
EKNLLKSTNLNTDQLLFIRLENKNHKSNNRSTKVWGHRPFLLTGFSIRALSFVHFADFCGSKKNLLKSTNLNTDQLLFIRLENKNHKSNNRSTKVWGHRPFLLTGFSIRALSFVHFADFCGSKKNLLKSSNLNTDQLLMLRMGKKTTRVTIGTQKFGAIRPFLLTGFSIRALSFVHFADFCGSEKNLLKSTNLNTDQLLMLRMGKKTQE